MKRFILAAIVLGAIGLGIYYLIYFQGFYIPKDSTAPVEVPFKTEGSLLLQRTQAGDYEEFQVRGVELSASMPGYYSNDFHPSTEDYLRWLTAIGEMGANTVRVPVIMDDDFYNAFYKYNTTAKKPLYLLQSFQVPDAAAYGTGTAYDDSALNKLMEDGEVLIDILHGRRSVMAGAYAGGGTYRKDVSPWVIGVIVGGDWNPDMVAFTDHQKLYSGQYDGQYFKTSDEGTAFEAMLARVLDTIAAYEARKYGVLRPLGFSNSPETDFLEYDENYALQLKKYSFIDAQHIIPTQAMEGGYFAAYHLLDYCDDFSLYLSSEQKEGLGTLIQNLDTDDGYSGYLSLLAGYHTMPVIASSYGLSTSRGVADDDQKPLSEEEQGIRLMEIYEEAVNAGWAGMCISTFQDVWDQTDWNTAFAENIDTSYLWGDIQTVGKNYGLMAFEPGEETSACIVDGNPEEWAQETPVFSNGSLDLYAKYDWKGLYLLIKGDFDPEQEQLYIPIDSSPDVGSYKADEQALAFDRPADFILCLDGKSNSRLLVWERYQAIRANFNTEIYGVDPYVDVPDKESSLFVPILSAVDNDVLLENYAGIDPELRRELTALKTWESGRLVYGSNDAAASDYNSLGDFYFGDGCVELRIPWLLLNVGDPSTMSVHEDYYENYGVELQKISQLWLGIASKQEQCILKSFEVSGTGKKPEYHERLKASYDIIQSIWGGSSADVLYR